MTDVENSLLEGWEPNPPQMGDPDYSAYVELLQRVQNAALTICNEMKSELHPLLPYDDCAQIAASAAIFQSDGNGESDCTYWREGDTDGYDTDPSRDVSCTAQTCTIDAGFWTGVENDPLGLHTDKTSGSFSSAGTTLADVYSGSIAYELGLRTNDIVTDIDGMPVTSVEEVEAAIQALRDETSWTVTVDRGSSTLVFNYRVL